MLKFNVLLQHLNVQTGAIVVRLALAVATARIPSPEEHPQAQVLQRFQTALLAKDLVIDFYFLLRGRVSRVFNLNFEP
jgi:hypothetical protein